MAGDLPWSRRRQIAAAEISTLSGSTVRAAQAGVEMLGRLVPDTQRTAKLIEEISAASREQSAGAVQVNSAIQQLDKVIHQNTAATEPMAASSRELASRAEQLQSAIGYLRLSSPRNRRGVLCMSSQADEMISAATH